MQVIWYYNLFCQCNIISKRGAQVYNINLSNVDFCCEFQGRVVALDKTTMKVEKMTANVKRWNLTCVECHVCDSTKAVGSKSGTPISHNLSHSTTKPTK